MHEETIEDVPGLFLFRNFFSVDQCATITQRTVDLFQGLEKVADNQTLGDAEIPQPELVVSEKHNLPTKERYARLIYRDDESSRDIQCEYFPRYGDDGHVLAYCRGNANLPDFIDGQLLSSLQKSMEQLGLANPKTELNWKLTVNIYKSVDGVIAGFPFHVDIPSNGVVTMILNVQREALFQITNGSVTHDIRIPVGGLLVLSGESRYEWKHRVVPEKIETMRSNDIERVSLVLGFR